MGTKPRIKWQALRKAAGGTWAQLAKDLDTGYIHLTRLRNGTRTPSDDLLQRIRKAEGKLK